MANRAFDISVAHIAWVNDYWPASKDSNAADRAAEWLSGLETATGRARSRQGRGGSLRTREARFRRGPGQFVEGLPGGAGGACELSAGDVPECGYRDRVCRRRAREQRPDMAGSGAKGRLVHPLQKRVVNPAVMLAHDLGIPPPGDALLETTGRQTGRQVRTPVCDGLDGEVFWLIAGAAAAPIGFRTSRPIRGSG
jgi:hypothetical protein